MLHEKCGLKDTIFVIVEENLATFLQVVGHGIKMRMVGGTYHRSLETISRNFSTILSAILSLSSKFIKLPDPTMNPPDEMEVVWKCTWSTRSYYEPSWRMQTWTWSR